MLSPKARTRLLRRITPTRDQMDQIRALVDQLKLRLRAVLGMVVIDFLGSSARETCLRGHRQIDLFLALEPDQTQLALIRSVIPRSEIRRRTGGMTYVTGVFPWRGLTYTLDLVPYPVTYVQNRLVRDRTYQAHRFMVHHLTPDLRDQILISKHLMKKVGLYSADDRWRGFSGWALEVLVHRYGSLWGMPQGTSWLEDPVAPGRNLLASLSPGNLNRFYNLRTLNFKYNPGRDPIPHLYLWGRKEKPPQDRVRRVVSLSDRTYVELKQVQKVCRKLPLPQGYYPRRQGVSLYLGLPLPLKVQRIQPLEGMTLVRPEDHTHLRIYHYFK